MILSNRYVVVFIILFLLVQIIVYLPTNNTTKSNDPYKAYFTPNEFSKNNAEDLLSNAPIAFTENRGQLENDEVRFYDQGGAVWFTDSGVWFEVREEIKSRESRVESRESDEWYDPMDKFEPPEPVEYKRVILKQEFVDANHVIPEGKDRLITRSNFFYGNNSNEWYTNVPNYAEVFYKDIYDGIDLRYYTNEKGLKYDFIVHPSVDPNLIRIRYHGADGLEIDSYEKLVVKTKIEDITDGGLFIYQNHNNELQRINGQYKIYNDFEYGFGLLDNYDKTKNLIIDPFISLKYSTYIGGSNLDENFHIDVDSYGNAYVSGWTNSSDFPYTPGSFDNAINDAGEETYHDAFVFKLSPDGSTLIYSTFIGGDNHDNSVGIIVDTNGSAIITGTSDSSDFPTTFGAFDRSHNGYSDAYILKLNTEGSDLLFSTFIGGSETDWGEDIAIDDNDNVIVGGFTMSMEFPITTGCFDDTYNSTGNGDGFILKMNHNGSNLIFSTFIGGNGQEYVRSIEIDSDANVYAVGITSSADFPVTQGAYDVTYYGVGSDSFCLELDHSGSDLIFSTYLGGNSSFAWGNDLAIADDGSVHIIGDTYSADFANTTGAFDTTFNGVADAFVMKLDPTGSKLLYSTFIGGNSLDYQCGIAVDPEGNVIITGWTNSTDFPITPDAYCKFKNGMRDVFIARLSANGSQLLYSTYLGGTGYDYGYYFGFDLMNNVYMTGSTNSSDFPITPDVVDPTFNGGYDGFLIKLAIPPIVIITSVELLKNNNTVNITYSKLCPYTLRTKITDNPGRGELKRVRLSLDPFGSNIQLIWNRSTNKFSKINDPNNFIILEPSSKAYAGSLNGWLIDFNITFNWTYPDEEFQNVQVYATNDILAPIWYNASKLFRVENDLVFNGTLSVKDEEYNLLNDNDLVRGGETLNWTGLKPVYEGTNDTYPLDNEFDITIWDETQNLWIDSPELGENFSIQTTVDKITDLDGNIHVVNITGIPPECDKTNCSFTIRIDGDNITFSDPKPEQAIWQNRSLVEVGINITDLGGGVVVGSSVMHSYSIDDKKTWNNWKQIQGLDSAVSIEPVDAIYFNEGVGNFIKWEAQDSVGNGPDISKEYRIAIDTEPIIFSNATPTSTNVSYSTEVEVGITIADKTSGVNALSIEYKLSNDTGNTWTKWIPVIGLSNASIVNVTLELTFPNGTSNRIKWRASDIAGNGPTESRAYTIRINTELQRFIPQVRLWSPPDGAVVPTNSVKLFWLLENTDLVGVSYDIYFDTKTPNKPNITGITDTSIKLDNLINGQTYYWTVIPKFGNETGFCSSGVWSFKVDVNVFFPTVRLLRPENGSIVSSNKPTFTWSVEYYGTETLSYEVYLDSQPELITYEESFNKYYLPSIILEDNQTYYWKVIPKAGSIVGPESEIWSFTVKKDYVPHFELELRVEPDGIVMEPASIKNIKAFVINKGELTDRITLSIELPSDSEMGGMVNDPNMLEAEPGETALFSITLTTSRNIETAEIIINVTATSGEAFDHGLEYEKECQVKVILFVEEKPEPERVSEWLYIWGMLIIVIVIILALIIFFVLRRKKEAKEPIPKNIPDTQEPIEPPIPIETQEPITPEGESDKLKTSDISTQEQAQEKISEPRQIPEQPTIVPEELNEVEEEICE